MEERIEPIPAWQARLLDERKELMEKTMAIQKALDNPDLKMTRREWDMLTRQSWNMKEYLQVLTERCAYYGLIESCDLGLKYPKVCEGTRG